MFAPRSPTFFPFELAADELRKEEFARLADAVPPTLEALRSLTPAQLRAEVTLMLERLGYLVHSDASAHDLVVTKDGRKYIVACAPPADREPTPTRDLARLHAAVVAATAERAPSRPPPKPTRPARPSSSSTAKCSSLH